MSGHDHPGASLGGLTAAAAAAAFDALAAVGNRAGYIWLSRRWPHDDRALDAVIALNIAARRPRGPTVLPVSLRLARARRAADRAADALAALAACPAMDQGQRDEVAVVAAAVRAAARP